MSTHLTCRVCDAPMADDTTGTGCCPACLLREGLFTTPGVIPESQPGEGGPRFFGQYELIEEIGRGGMGVVYRARQRNLNRTVAIKQLAAGAYSSESLLHRFQVEAESAAGLQHPGIVAIFECGEHDNHPYYAMEFIDGRNLAEVSGGQPMEPRRAARYLHAICSAVQHAHNHGILHRDLKPSNVLVDADDRPRITDFGLAKRLDGGVDMTIDGQVLGSPNYSSPEQVSGKQEHIGTTSDVYSLGALLYHLLTGRPPFLAGTISETLRLVQDSEPIAPQTLNPAVPVDLNTVCLKCLEKDPARRYPTARALADELQRFIDGVPIHARAITGVERGLRWCRRHPAPAALVATVVLALSGTSLLFYTSARTIEHARAQEELARRAAEQNLYAANMQVTSRAFNTVTGASPTGLIANLRASRPAPGERDLRGFEWRYFWTQSQTDAAITLRGQGHFVTKVTYSSDGSRLATLGANGVLKVWDTESNREITAIEGVAPPGALSLDSGRLIFSRQDGSIWQSDLESHAARMIRGAGAPAVALVHGGGAAIVVDSQGLPAVQSLEATPPGGAAPHPMGPLSTAVSADGRRAAVAGPMHGPFIRVVDLAGGGPAASVAAGDRPVIALALSADGSLLAGSSFSGEVRIWDVETGALVHGFRAFLDPVWGIAFSPDGSLLALGGNNRKIKICDTRTWRELEILSGHESTVTSLAFSPDGKRIASGSEDELVMIWTPQRSRPVEEARQLLRGAHWTEKTPSLAFSPDSEMFAGTASDGTVKVWRSDSLDVVGTLPVSARTVAFGPDGKSVLTEDFSGNVQRWSLLGNLEAAGSGAAFTANWLTDPLSTRERVALVAERAAAGAVSECQLCEIPNARDSLMGPSALTSHVVAMSPDGRAMFIGLPDGTVEAWDVGTQRPRFTINAHKVNVTAVSLSPDNRYLATGGLDNATHLWNAQTGEHFATFYDHNRPVWALAFSPDGKTLAAGSCDKEIILCNLVLMRHVASLPLYTGEPKDYEQEVRLLRFSPDGNSLAAALGDGTLRFFRAAPFSETDRGAFDTSDL